MPCFDYDKHNGNRAWLTERVHAVDSVDPRTILRRSSLSDRLARLTLMEKFRLPPASLPAPPNYAAYFYRFCIQGELWCCALSSELTPRMTDRGCNANAGSRASPSALPTLFRQRFALPPSPEGKAFFRSHEPGGAGAQKRLPEIPVRIGRRPVAVPEEIVAL